MCGIVGIFSYGEEAPDVDQDELCRIRDHMSARGPDGLGIWLSPDCRVGLGHRRLAIIDLSENGAQPMFSADGNLAITFNGEIYNYEALREQLLAQGCFFRSHSDTEVLLALYALKGKAMVNDLRGMFAFAIWDFAKRGIFLARDPYGIKPLYYADDGKQFVFASQVKALLVSDRISHNPDPAGWVGYYLLGSVPEPFTTYSAISALDAGSTLWIDKSGPQRRKQYFSIAATYCAAEKQSFLLPEEERQKCLKDALLDCVRHHLVADVPVGIFLSGGIDSGTLLASTWELGNKNIQTITIAFEEFRGQPRDERRLSEEVARRYGASHTTRMVSQEEFYEDMPKILASMDQPSIDGPNSWFASKAAKELGLKVVISGLGGDELFNGYPSFKSIPRWIRVIDRIAPLPFGRQILRYALINLNRKRVFLSPKTSSLIDYGQTYEGAYLLRRGLFMPPELNRLMDAHFVTEGLHRLRLLERFTEALTPRPKTAAAKIAILEASVYMRNQLLRDMDWASMAHGVEVRVPFVDSHLLRRLAGLLLSGGISEWKEEVAANPRLPLPSKVIRRSKAGFETPTSQWIQRDDRLNYWKRCRDLTKPGTPWARQWAYEVAALQTGKTSGIKRDSAV